MVSCTMAQAQRAWPGSITGLLSRVPIPGASSSCYSACTKTTDPSNGLISIKDNGPGFTGLQDKLEEIAREAMAGASASGMAAPAGPPSADQIEQMKQQAMQRAAADQSMTPQQMAQQQHYGSAPASGDIAVMKLIGSAQTAASQITVLVNELSMKMNKLTKDKIEAVKQEPACPGQGPAGAATCECLIAHAVDYYTRRLAGWDDRIRQVTALLEEYMPKFKTQTAIIDDMEAKAKYGDALTNPSFRQMVVSIQHQALNSLTCTLGISGGVWGDAASEYANLVNARSGASFDCKGKNTGQ